YEYAQVVAPESKCHLFGPSGRGDDEIRPAGPIDRPEAEEHRRGADGQRPTDGLFVANPEESLDVLSQESADRRERREQRVPCLTPLDERQRRTQLDLDVSARDAAPRVDQPVDVKRALAPLPTCPSPQRWRGPRGIEWRQLQSVRGLAFRLGLETEQPIEWIGPDE